MKIQEKLLLEAIDTFLNQDAKLGLKDHFKQYKDPNNDNGVQYLQENINESFALEIADLENHDNICRAFRKTHERLGINHPKLVDSLVPELRATGVPQEEINKAVKAVEKIVKEFATKDDSYIEAIRNMNIGEGRKTTPHDALSSGVAKLLIARANNIDDSGTIWTSEEAIASKMKITDDEYYMLRKAKVIVHTVNGLKVDRERLNFIRAQLYL